MICPCAESLQAEFFDGFKESLSRRIMKLLDDNKDQPVAYNERGWELISGAAIEIFEHYKIDWRYTQ